MPEYAWLFTVFPAIQLAEILVVLALAMTGYVVFNNFEKHLPIIKRIAKLVVLVGVLSLLGLLLGRYVFWGIIALMTIGQIVLHAWYFPKNGINGLTAEPRDQYLQLINKMKGSNK